jgi:hypothetical protein
VALPNKYQRSDDLIAWLALLYDEISLRQSVADLTSATSDYSLSVNETAKITITEQSTVLRVAMENGLYEMSIVFDPNSFSADRNLSLTPNGVTQTNEIESQDIQFSTNVATDELDVMVTTTDSAFRLNVTSVIPSSLKSTIMIFDEEAVMMTELYALNDGTYETQKVNSRWRTADWTSLGTLDIGEVAEAVCYVKRIA